jgi:hypothetical protein
MRKAALSFLSVCMLVLVFSSCSWHPKVSSTYKDKDGVKKKEKYDPYKRKWYKKTWKNRSMWK